MMATGGGARNPTAEQFMSRRLTILVLIAVLAPAGRAPALVGESHGASQSAPEVHPSDLVPSVEEMQTRTRKVVANQHGDDNALDVYERLERYFDRTAGAAPKTLEDRTYRVVPTGGGMYRILLRDGSKRTDPAEYRKQLQLLESALEMMARPDDPKAKAARDKYEKRKRDRVQFVDATQDAFLPKWAGRETRDGRACDVFELNPNPAFHPHSMFQSALAHVTAKVWVDHQADQIVRGEARVTGDISFGGGVLGKLYRGGVVSMDQAEVAQGVWLPIRYQYDFAGRKFLFPFAEHQLIEVSRYHRVGTPPEALPQIRDELTTGKFFASDP
jgi:hypothetical protein